MQSRLAKTAAANNATTLSAFAFVLAIAFAAALLLSAGVGVCMPAHQTAWADEPTGAAATSTATSTAAASGTATSATTTTKSTTKKKKVKAHFRIKKGKLQYVMKNGKLKRSGTVDGIEFKSNGYARKTLASELKILIMKRIDKLTKKSDKRSKKLSKCWKWVLGFGSYNLSGAIDDIRPVNWIQQQAYRSMTTGMMECFGGPAMIAMFAHELGYKDVKVQVVPYYHADAYINGHRYSWAKQPQMSGTSGRWFTPTSYSSAKVKGTGSWKGKKPKKANDIYHAVTAEKVLRSKWVTKKGKKYWYTPTGEKAKGLHLVKGKLTWFSKKGIYSASKSKKYRKVAKADQPAAALLKLLGTPKSTVTYKSSCYTLGSNPDLAGADRIRTFAHVKVSTFVGENGVEYLESLEAI